MTRLTLSLIYNDNIKNLNLYSSAHINFHLQSCAFVCTCCGKLKNTPNEVQSCLVWIIQLHNATYWLELRQHISFKLRSTSNFLPQYLGYFHAYDVHKYATCNICFFPSASSFLKCMRAVNKAFRSCCKMKARAGLLSNRSFSPIMVGWHKQVSKKATKWYHLQK